MSVEFFQVDAFTNEAFRGNPAAVCFLSGTWDETWMQNVAAEMNLAETAFARPAEDGFDLRWFTPLCEVDLCGHATLATAHALWETGKLDREVDARFFTKSGVLGAKRNGDWVELDFPAVSSEPADVPGGLETALGAAPEVVRRHRFGYLAEFESERVVRAMRPDIARLKEIPGDTMIVTCASETKDFDFVSRMFAPSIGIDEDPVTGSAHCCLGPYWKERLGKDEFTAYQASARGGVVKVVLRKDRVLLLGQAVTVLRGEIV